MGSDTVRINIYVHDSEIRRRVKAAAARAGKSMSEYCLEAIVFRLDRDDQESREPRGEIPEDFVDRVRRFQDEVFGDRVISISAAELVRESREQH